MYKTIRYKQEEQAPRVYFFNKTIKGKIVSHELKESSFLHHMYVSIGIEISRFNKIQVFHKLFFIDDSNSSNRNVAFDLYTNTGIYVSNNDLYVPENLPFVNITIDKEGIVTELERRK